MMNQGWSVRLGVLPPQNAHMIDAGQNKGAAGAYSLRWSLEASRPPCRPFPPSWEHVFRGALFFGRSPVIDFKCQAALFSRVRSLGLVAFLGVKLAAMY
ncbi:hypothetical protein C1N76_10325 [Geobacillus thermoleovorans]|uniref:Uncharacterized protein n=1 Tax=Geobacillus thermoleovorans TaxID=33941 RepID=A0A2Z3N7K8_GEOTH|nr:hypothetical protein C1N76_10325 [Geobacillus thermoleovorans]